MAITQRLLVVVWYVLSDQEVACSFLANAPQVGKIICRGQIERAAGPAWQRKEVKKIPVVWKGSKIPPSKLLLEKE
jgi:hypothetical protein